ncbi:MAG: right-handed parallel beta-helix repeat-containing protein [Phycisphaerae bacterium]|nr:right-handed parallel beta-helix repeat-containing protein [Phycisphaerae bacterium]
MSKNQRLSVILFALQLCTVAVARNYYVSLEGDDSASGNKKHPFRTLQKATEVLAPGDVCCIRKGRYTENVMLNGLKGKAEEKIVFKSYKGEEVIFDGSDVLDVKWQRYRDGIYKAKLSEDIWQLFVDGKSMSSARWPNGNWDDGSVWDKTKSMMWPEKGRSEFGHQYNIELKDFDFSLENGGIVIVNSGSFRTYKSFVTEHKAGSDNFKFDTSTAKQHHGTYPAYKHGYFLEGKLGLLDVEGEWFYEPKEKMLYLWPPDGKKPQDLKIKGKRRSYAFDGTNCSYVKIIGIDLFATTFRFDGCDNITVVNCNLLYPSYSKRMLRDISPMDVTKMVMDEEFDMAYNTIRDCVIEYADGPAIEMNGCENVIENNYIHSIDYSCTYAGGWTLKMVDAPRLVLRRNTIHTTGASEMFKAGVRNLIQLNDISRTGYLQNDGALIQISVKQQDRSETSFNWVHDSVKIGLRFDNSNVPGSPWGESARAHHNVAWAVDRTFFKGDKHYIYNNLTFDCQRNDLIPSSDVETNGRNFETVTRNNIAGNLSGHRTKPGKDYPVPGVVDHNWAANFKGRGIRTQLRDPDNLDFRPKAKSELVDAGASIKVYEGGYMGKSLDIGPYEYGDAKYWIPGRKVSKASVAIPPNGTETAKADADLMWLGAYKATSHDIYFATDEQAVTDAMKESPEFKGSTEGNINIFNPGKLKPGKKYYWRIDAVVHGKVVKGDVWSFTVNGNSK